MNTKLYGILMFAISLAACSNDAGTTGSSGTGGTPSATGGSGGDSTGTSGGSGGGGTGGATAGTGGSTGGSDTTGSGGNAGAEQDASMTTTDDGAAGSESSDASDDAPSVVMGDGGSCSGTIYGAGVACPGGTPSDGTTPCASVEGPQAKARACKAVCTTCPPDHQQCCPAPKGATTGYDVGGLLLGRKDAVTFTGVYAPADGDYNIVWYYHCGNTDTDNNYPPTCPGSKEGATMGPAGCRQALFSVNGVDDPAVYEVPCFLNGTVDGMWPTIHSWVRDDPATKVLVPFHLKKGSNNAIKIFADTHDTVDLSAILVPDGR